MSCAQIYWLAFKDGSFLPFLFMSDELSNFVACLTAWSVSEQHPPLNVLQTAGVISGSIHFPRREVCKATQAQVGSPGPCLLMFGPEQRVARSMQGLPRRVWGLKFSREMWRGGRGETLSNIARDRLAGSEFLVTGRQVTDPSDILMFNMNSFKTCAQ